MRQYLDEHLPTLTGLVLTNIINARILFYMVVCLILCFWLCSTYIVHTHILAYNCELSQPTWKWYLSHRRTAKARASRRIHEVSQQPLLFAHTIWATSWQNQQNGMCAQRRLRSAWASAQSFCLFCREELEEVSDKEPHLVASEWLRMRIWKISNYTR